MLPPTTHSPTPDAAQSPAAPADCVYETVKTSAGAALAGLAVSAFQNTISKHDHGARGVLTRSGSTITTFAVVGGVFAATECFVANLRGTDVNADAGPHNGEKADAVPSTIAGCAAGIVASMRSKSIAVSLGACSAMGATMYAYQRSGGWLRTDAASREAFRRERLDSAEAKERRRREFFKHPEQARLNAQVRLPEDEEADAASVKPGDASL